MDLTTNRTLSVWDGEWVDTSAETLHGAATEFARRRGWREGTWRAVTDIEELDAYHHPVARRRFRVLRAGTRIRRVDAQAGDPVGFVVPPTGMAPQAA